MMQAVSFVNNVTFSLIKTGIYNFTTVMLVGTKVHFQLEIAFPVGTTDLLVELLNPYNDTAIITLCNPQITFIGTNIQYSETNATFILDPVPGTLYVSLCYKPKLESFMHFCLLFGLTLCSLLLLWINYY